MYRFKSSLAETILLNACIWLTSTLLGFFNYSWFKTEFYYIQWFFILPVLAVLWILSRKDTISFPLSSRMKKIIISVNLIPASVLVWFTIPAIDMLSHINVFVLFVLFYFTIYFYHLSLKEILVSGLLIQGVLLIYLPVYEQVMSFNVNSVIVLHYYTFNLFFFFLLIIFSLERYFHAGFRSGSKKTIPDPPLHAKQTVPVYENIKEDRFKNFYKDLSEFYKTLMMSSSVSDDLLREILKTTGRTCSADRVYVFDFIENNKYMKNTYKWCEVDVKPEIENLQHLPVSDFPWWMSKLNNKEVIYVNALNELPPEAIHEKETLEIQHIRSIIVAGIYIRDRPIGFVGVDFVKNSKSPKPVYINIITQISELLACAFIQHDNMQPLFSDIGPGFDLPTPGLLNRELLMKHFFKSVFQTPILVIDSDLRILTMNRKAKELFPSSDKPKQTYSLTDLSIKKSADLDLMVRTIKRTLLADGIQSIDSDVIFEIGSRYFSLFTHKITDNKNKPRALMIYLIDVTNQYVTRLHLVKAIEEKERLLSEIHHRVKNNMQIISSLMDLKSMIIDEKNALAVFNDTKDRLSGLALLHEKLYESRDFGKTQLNTYFHELIENIIFLLSGDKNISFKFMTSKPVLVNFDKAITLGLLMNEIVVNSLKHAFHNRNEGEIQFGYSIHDSRMIIKLSDNGSGFAEETAGKSKHTLGLKLIDGFVHELGGEYIRKSDQGTSYTIHIPLTPDETDLTL
jgi:two-component sensor histidine kinase